MAFCRACGRELAEGQLVCTGCGVPATEPVAVNVKAEEKNKRAELNVGMFIWSLVNLILCSQVAAGVIALIFTLLAKGEELEKAARYNKIARIANIVGTVLGVLTVLLVIVYVFFIFFVIGMSELMYY